MKITSENAKTIMAWCEQAPKVRERINWDNLPDKQKDSAVIAYLLDLGTPYAITMANRLNLPSCAENVKESALRNTEYEIQYLVRQYNDMLDLQDAERSTERPQSYCKKTFDSIFGVNKKLYEAGHRPEDFC